MEAGRRAVGLMVERALLGASRRREERRGLAMVAEGEMEAAEGGGATSRGDKRVGGRFVSDFLRARWHHWRIMTRLRPQG